MGEQSISRRIISEIDAIKSKKELKLFLKKIILVELENFDRSLPRYQERYKKEIEIALEGRQ